MKKVFCILVVFCLPVFAAKHGEERKSYGELEVYHQHSSRWLSVDDFFLEEIQRLNGPTYVVSNDQYPSYNSVSEWETLIDVLPDGSHCPMVFFHNRWRRLADVLALSKKLRNWGGCARVFN